MASNKSEKNEIKRDGGKAQKNSGRGQYSKGDATLEPFLYDIKEYENSFSITKAVWAKACTDAFTKRMVPAIKVVLGSSDKTRLWIVGDSMFQEMHEAWLEKYHDLGG